MVPPLRSLSLKLLLPLLALLVVADVVVVVLVQQSASSRLEEQLHHRGQMVATAVTFAAEGADRIGQLERFVAALGSERTVRDIVVVAGETPTVVASTRNDWNARPVAELERLPDWPATGPATASGEQGRFDARSGTYLYVQPLVLSIVRRSGYDLTHGRIVIKLDASMFQTSLQASTARLATWLVVITIVFHLLIWLLLRRLVLRPIAEIGRGISAGTPLRATGTGDEFDLLAAAYQRAVDDQRASERRLNGLIENASDLIYVKDRHGAITYASPSFAHVVGIDPEGLVGRPCLELVEPADRAAVEAAMQETIRSPGQRVSFEQRLRDPHHGVRVFSCIAVSLIGSSVLDGVVVTCHDITDRKAAEARLRRGLDEVEGLLDAVSAVLIGIDSGNRVVRWNRSAERVTGRLERDVIGRTLADCGVGWALADLMRAVDMCRASSSTVELVELRCRRDDGHEAFLQLSLCPGFSDEPTVLILGRDATETKLMQSQINQSQKLESIGQLAAGVAHEINTPTQFVGDNLRFLADGFADLARVLAAQRQALDPATDPARRAELMRSAATATADADVDYLLTEIPRAISQSLEGTGRIATIVGAMKDFAHPDTGEMKPCDLNRVVTTTLTVARNEYKYVAQLVADLQEDLPQVTCLAGEVGQVVLNMVVNAAHAIAEKGAGQGTIRVATRAVGDEVQIAIADSGTGIPPAVRERIFDPFFTTKPVGKGTGQGLFLAHAVVVRKHGGRIDVASVVGEGTTFTIVLPRVAA